MESRDLSDVRLIVDAMNVIGSRPTGWWRNRDAALGLLIERLQRLAVAEGCALTLIADGRPVSGLPEGEHGAVEVLYANRGGRNAADDRIVEYVTAHPHPGSLEVISSDRDLRRRVAVLGALLGSPSALLKRLDELGR
jgi:predicted RNA-binding protein with PIN domain